MTGRWRRLLVATGVVTMGAGCGPSDEPDQVGEVEPVTRIEYGDHADAFGDLWLPEASAPASKAPVVVLVHGGFWRDGFFLDLMDPLIPSLLEQGFVVWNIEYRRVGAGGGYPETFEDVAAATDHLSSLPTGLADRVDLSRVAVVGHSAGGHLAAWAAGRPSLPTGEVGADPDVIPRLVVSQAGVLDLVGCVEDGVGGTACSDLVGVQPQARPERYALTSPTEMVPFDAVIVAVHGESDRIVPTDQSVTFVDRAVESGMTASYVPIPDADHFSNLDPAHPAWSTVLEALTEHL